MRTGDTTYGAEYWDTLDNGAGYQDSVMHEDLAHIIKETFGYENGEDISGQVNIVEFGCAAGYLVKHLRRRGHDAWGLDFSEYVLDLAPDDVKEYLRQYDMRSPDGHHFGSNTFKVAICFETMEHIPEPYVMNALARIYDTIVPGGYAIFTICVAEHPDPFDDPTHVTIRPRAWWAHRLAVTGFSGMPELLAQVRGYWLFSQHNGVFICRRP